MSFSWITSDNNRTILNPWAINADPYIFRVTVLFCNGDYYYGRYNGFGCILDEEKMEICEIFSRSYEIYIGKKKKKNSEKEFYRNEGLRLYHNKKCMFKFLGRPIDTNTSKNDLIDYFNKLKVSLESPNNGEALDENTNYIIDETRIFNNEFKYL